MKSVTLYTDGACSGNPGPGGWGAVLQYEARGKTHEKVMGGGAEATTNNRMELTAVIEGLNVLKAPCAVTVYTDSRYVMDGVQKYLEGWKRRGWKTADKKPVKNIDLWETLDAAIRRHDIKWIWVKGHAGNAGNERADQIARDNIPRPPVAEA